MCAYELRLAPSARRTLARLPIRIATAVIAFIEGRLLENPWRIGKLLRDELLGSLAAKVGAYRVVYQVDDSIPAVLVTRIDHRADIYRPR